MQIAILSVQSTVDPFSCTHTRTMHDNSIMFLKMGAMEEEEYGK